MPSTSQWLALGQKNFRLKKFSFLTVNLLANLVDLCIYHSNHVAFLLLLYEKGTLYDSATKKLKTP